MSWPVCRAVVSFFSFSNSRDFIAPGAQDTILCFASQFLHVQRLFEVLRPRDKLLEARVLPLYALNQFASTIQRSEKFTPLHYVEALTQPAY